MMEYVKINDLKAVLSKIKKNRDTDVLMHPERAIIWKWAINNFERKIAENEDLLKKETKDTTEE